MLDSEEVIKEALWTAIRMNTGANVGTIILTDIVNTMRKGKNSLVRTSELTGGMKNTERKIRMLPLDELLLDFAKRKGRSPEYFMDILNGKHENSIPIGWIEQYVNSEIEMYGVEIPEVRSIRTMLNEWKKDNDR